MADIYATVLLPEEHRARLARLATAFAERAGTTAPAAMHGILNAALSLGLPPVLQATEREIDGRPLGAVIYQVPMPQSLDAELEALRQRVAADPDCIARAVEPDASEMLVVVLQIGLRQAQAILAAGGPLAAAVATGLERSR
jgi:hypothetical protein